LQTLLFHKAILKTWRLDPAAAPDSNHDPMLEFLNRKDGQDEEAKDHGQREFLCATRGPQLARS
jgi:hypothetical protein